MLSGEGVEIVNPVKTNQYVLFPGLQSDTYQEDIYPMTAGTEPALSASEWLSGINRGRCTSLLALCFTNINVQPGPAFWRRKCCSATQPCSSTWFFSALWSAFTRCHGAYGLAPTTEQNKQLHLRRKADGKAQKWICFSPLVFHHTEFSPYQ